MAGRKTIAGSLVVTDTDGCAGEEGLARLHTGKGHSPHPDTPGPVPHPAPGPRGRNPVATGAVNGR